MIWFWILAGLLVLATLIALLKPLLRTKPGDADEGEPAAATFRRQLANLDSEVAQGRITAEDATAVRAEITRRMLAAADQEVETSRRSVLRTGEASWRIGAAIGIAALLPAAALVVYAAVGTPAAVEGGGKGAAAGAPHDRSELAAAAEQLEARLQKEPGHVEGWILLARTFTALQRFPEARTAYGQAIALAPNEPQLHAELGELLVLMASGNVTKEAEAEFVEAGDDPRARFYTAEAALQRGDRDAAKAGLRALLAEAPADAPWRKVVQERLAEIAPDEQSPEPKLSGPTAQDVAAARSMSPEDREAMIRSMVDRLAARLEQNPNDKEGWSRLARAYDALGEPEKAAAARARGAQIPKTEK
ncbi:MAG: c-type cytochrome biogenesis protein CcmI [Alphaproteobacteria bacterium]|nr:c-type cytochrome biogenesis protein CcmI [Alphaproteobacteria bacterium]MBV9199022.1 c-type cytochrome biogenesis protein CcmI [Alphaproteobacteria bacterium]MBV9814385.1 c-type cytochrome biogenesis protein CcmI [Alphaproteobacteria bacterium]